MALKDWGLIGHKLGRKKNVTQYMSKKKPIIITMVKDGFGKDNKLYPYVINISYANGIDMYDKGFKTKSQALKYAKDYMRKH